MRAVALMIIALLVGFPGPAAAGTQPASLAEVLAELEVDEVPADYVVLVDTSGSMADNGRYERVREVLRAFFGSLRPIDRVSLRTFDLTPAVVYRGAPDGAVAAVDRMPAQPTGNTDIGAAIDTALDDLSQPDAHPAAAVVLFTDGAQNAPNSPYADPNGNGPAWAELNRRAAGLTGRTVRGFAFPLTDETSGAGLLKAVIPRTEVLNQPIDQLGDYLRRTADELRRALAADLLTPDLAGTVAVRWPDLDSGADLSGPDIPITVWLTSTTRNLPVELTDAEVVTDLGPVTGLPDRITLRPGQPVPVELTLRPTAAGRFTLGTTTLPVDTQLRLTGRLDSPWREVVERDLGTRLDLRAVDAPTTVRGSISYGLPWWMVLAAIAVILLVAAALLIRWTRRNPRLVGALLVDPPTAAPVPIELTGRRRVRLDRGRTGRALGITGPCTIRGRRTSRYDPPTLTISYAPRGTDPVTRLCPPGGHQEIAGLRFWYLANSHGTPTGHPGYPTSVPR